MEEEYDINEIPYIPFFGGDGIPPNTKEDDIANWVRPQDKIPLILCLSLYSTPIENFNNWNIVKNSVTPRAAAWFNDIDGSCIIGLKGTSGKSGALDFKDDTVRNGQDTATNHIHILFLVHCIYRIFVRVYNEYNISIRDNM